MCHVQKPQGRAPEVIQVPLMQVRAAPLSLGKQVLDAEFWLHPMWSHSLMLTLLYAHMHVGLQVPVYMETRGQPCTLSKESHPASLKQSHWPVV